MKSEIVLAAYRPHNGKEDELLALLKEHVPVLSELELVTNRPSLTMKSIDGTIIEVIEWVNSNAANKAHEHPLVAQIWEKIGMISEFIPLNELSEAKKAFSHFEVINN